MSTDTAAASPTDLHAPAAHAAPHVVHGPGHHFQYDTPERQFHAAKFGMWLFMGQEILFFGALFSAYAFYRNQFPAAFEAASHHLNHTFGAIETVDLLVSSWMVAMSIHFIREGKKNLTALCLVGTIICAFIFLGMHSFEYYTEFHEGFLPGKYFHSEELTQVGAPMFFTVYFFLTGVHSIHVIIGIGVLGWLLVRVLQGKFDSKYNTPVEIAGLYWHLVDLIWIFLFPLLYLIG
jgi:cytochrome c oxidase subunit 3